MDSFPYNFLLGKKHFSHKEFTGKPSTPSTQRTKNMIYTIDMKRKRADFGASLTLHHFEGAGLEN